MVCNRAAMRNEDLPASASLPACQPVCLSVCQRAAHPATPSLPLPPSVSSSLVVPYFRRLIPVIWGHFRRNWAGKTDGRTERGRSTVVSNMHVVRRSLACMHSHPRFDQKGKQRETNQSIVRNLNHLSFSSLSRKQPFKKCGTFCDFMRKRPKSGVEA